MANRIQVVSRGVSALVVDTINSRVLAVFADSEGYDNVILAAEQYAAKINVELDNARKVG